MATVTGTFAINFASLPNANPYSNPLFIKADDASVARIDSGVFRSINNNTPAAFYLDPDEWVPGSALTVKVELSTAGGGADSINAGVLDASGNGYVVWINGWGIQRRRMDGGAEAAGGADAWDATVAMSDGDVVEVSYNKATGAFSVTRNSSAVSELSATLTTHNDKALLPFFGPWPGNDGAGGIISLAVDGVTAAGGGSATKLSFSAQPGNTAVGQTMSAVQVSAVDDDNELDTDFDGDVTIALQTGTGTLSGTLTKAAVAGVATFDDLSINAVNTGAVLRATSSGLTQADSAPFNITALTAHIREQLIDKNGDAVANETGITMVVYHAVPTEAAPNPSEVIEGVSTDANGDIDEEIAIGSLEEDDPVWIALVKDGTPPQGTFKKVVPVYE